MPFYSRYGKRNSNYNTKRTNQRPTYRAKRRKVPYKMSSQGIIGSKLMKTPKTLPTSVEMQLAFGQLYESTTSTTWNNLDFRLNSAFAPYSSGTSTTSLAFGQIAQLYNNYQVKGVMVEWEAANPSTNRIGLIGGYHRVNTTDASDWHDLQARDNAWTHLMEPASVKSGSYYVKLAELLGRELDFDRDAAVINANPDTPATLTMYAQAADLTTSHDIQWKIKLTYDTIFFNKKTVAAAT